MPINLFVDADCEKQMNMTTDNELKQKIYARLSGLLEDGSVKVSDETPLIGDDRALDSMKLLELCLALEDMGNEIGFEFDWTSETAMSKSRSMFRTAGSLADEFLTQMAAKK